MYKYTFDKMNRGRTGLAHFFGVSLLACSLASLTFFLLPMLRWSINGLRETAAICTELDLACGGLWEKSWEKSSQ